MAKIKGGPGNDNLVGTKNDDQIDGLGGDDTLQGLDGNDTLQGREGNDVLNGGAGDDELYGREGKDVLDGGAGNDTLAGGDGDDILIGGEGIDTARYSSAGKGVTVNLTKTAAQDTRGGGVDTLTGIENVVGSDFTDAIIGNDAENMLDGGSGDDRLNGGSGMDTLYGGDGADVLDGGTGADTFLGGLGDDVYRLDSSGDIILPDEGGIDTVYSPFSRTLSDDLENLELTGSAAWGTGNQQDNVIRGNNLANVLTGLDGNDTLDGSHGADTMDGGDGDDSYFVDNVGDKLIDSGGIDTVTVQGLSYTLASDFENLVLAGPRPWYQLVGTGNGKPNVITSSIDYTELHGLGGNDQLTGGTGHDTLLGGEGDDFLDGGAGSDDGSYGDSHAGVTVSLAISGPQDTGGSGVDTLMNIENLIGSGYDDVLTGDGGNNTLDGAGGSDVLNGGGGDDTLSGESANDYLDGGDGADLLDGGIGADTFLGGLGDDVYWLDSSGDTILPDEGGIDTVYSALSRALSADLENLRLTDSALWGTGNQQDNFIRGNNLDNVLTGLESNDTLDGFTGADTMDGGDGDDSYFVDNVGDKLIDSGGIDTVTVQGMSYTLASNLENLVLAGPRPWYRLVGTGNEKANVITSSVDYTELHGLGGNDRLTGGSGFDTLFGGEGDDFLDGAAGPDEASYLDADSGVRVSLAISGPQDTGGSGVDTLAGIEDLTGTIFNDVLTGDGGNNTLYGVSGFDTLSGLGGDDTLRGDGNLKSGAGDDLLSGRDSIMDGGGGDDTVVGSGKLMGGDGDDLLRGDGPADRLIGGAGDDAFRFTLVSSETRIMDFTPGEDRIELRQTSFKKVGDVGPLDPNAFFIGSSAHDSSDRIIYNSADGNLLYDPDGSGSKAATVFANVTAGLPLSASDFTVV